jgi:hypothetical protein
MPALARASAVTGPAMPPPITIAVRTLLIVTPSLMQVGRAALLPWRWAAPAPPGDQHPLGVGGGAFPPAAISASR